MLVPCILLCDASCVAILHIHALASHLGALDESCEDHGVESNSKMVFGGPTPKVEGLSKRCDLRCHQDEATN